MKNMLFLGALSFLAPVFLTSCSDDDTMDNDLGNESSSTEFCENLSGWTVTPRNSSSIPLNLTTKELEVVGANTQLSTKLLAKVRTSNENTMVAPYSLQLALAMINNGTSPDVQKEVNDFIGLQGMDMQEINNTYSKISASLNSELDIAACFETQNSMWIQKDEKIRLDFYNVIKDSYKASVADLDFTKPEASQTIDDWANMATRGLIPSLNLKLNNNTKVVIANACYFKAKWTKNFKDSLLGTFTQADGTIANVSFFHNGGTYSYAETDSYQALRLPYGNQTFCMDVILPTKNLSTENLMPSIDWNNINFTPEKVRVNMPKFTAKNRFDLRQTLIDMGLNSLFEKYLVRMGKDLILSELQQDTYVKVDQDGTEAAGITIGIHDTVIISPDPSGHKIFDADHPFLFAIREAKTGLILFMGEVVKAEL